LPFGGTLNGLNQTFYTPRWRSHVRSPPRHGAPSQEHDDAPARALDEPSYLCAPRYPSASRRPLAAGRGIVVAEEAEEVSVCADDVAERDVLVDGDVAEEELLQGGDVAGAAARVQAHRVRHLHHGLEKVGTRRARRHLDRVDLFVRQPQPGWRRALGLVSGGYATQREGVVVVVGLAAASRRAWRRGVLGRVDDGVGIAGRREEEAAGGDGVGQPRRVGLGLGLARVEDVVVEVGRRQSPRARRRRSRGLGRFLRRRRQVRPKDRQEAPPHHALRGPRGILRSKLARDRKRRERKAVWGGNGKRSVTARVYNGRQGRGRQTACDFFSRKIVFDGFKGGKETNHMSCKRKQSSF
jgi:hypothetical protein